LDETLFGTPIITFDIDWAPDFVIDAVAELLIATSIKSTWFVTHLSPAVLRLRKRPNLFELGIHPNFSVGSSHGAEPTAVIHRCLEFVPEARVVRTHGLVQSSNLLDQIFAEAPRLQTDVSLLLPRARCAEPHSFPFGGRLVTRMPYVWEDDLEMIRDDPWWRLKDCAAMHGLMIFDFHPIHVYMNAPRLAAYNALKGRVERLSSALIDQVEVEPPTSLGPGRILREIISYLTSIGRSYRISDLVPERA
jgi:hypothetical protein